MVIVFSLEPARFEFYTAEDVAPGTRTKPRSSSVSFRRSAATSGGAGTKAAARATTKTTIAVLMTKFQKASCFFGWIQSVCSQYSRGFFGWSAACGSCCTRCARQITIRVFMRERCRFKNK